MASHSYIKCPSCGTMVPFNHDFCHKCGSSMKTQPKKQEKATEKPSEKVTGIRCKACNAPIHFEKGKLSAVCEYCGTQNIINESDTVTVERIKSETEKDIHRDYIDLERENMRREDAKEQRNDEKEILSNYKDGVIVRLTTIFGIGSIAEICIAFSNSKVLPAIIAIAQLIIFSVSVLLGTKIIKTKRRWLYVPLCILGMSMLWLWLSTFNGKLSG